MERMRQVMQSRRRAFLLKPAEGYEKVSSIFWVLLLPLLPYVLQSASARTLSNRSDVDTLLAFKASLSNQPDVLAAWNTTTDFCSWPGISCSHKHKHRVTVLNLTSEGLAGTITPSIGNLTFLKILDLSQNNFHGQIPSSIGRLSRLQYLYLPKNLLHGEVNDNLKNCTNPKGINLSSNQLTGEIPAWLGGLSSLKSIMLMKNNFTGIIPPSLNNLSALQEIALPFNQLEGSIPEGLGKISSLKLIELGANHLSGIIPIPFFNLSSLITFSVSQNNLHGTLPYDLGNHLPNLQNLLLHSNSFTGSLPASIVNATEMYKLDLGSNNFTGRLPPEIGMLCPGFLVLETNQLMAATAQDWEFMTLLTNCTDLRILDLRRNMLGGALPSSVANLSTQLQLLWLGYNEISGRIPFGICNLVGLNELQLYINQFTGALPDCIGRLNLLEALHLNDNLLTGFLPSSLGNLTRLLGLFTYSNKFEGPLPTSLRNLQEITVASFRDNKLTGPLPKEIFNLSSLSYILDLSDNFFVGSLPSEVGSLTKLANLYISQNNLSGMLPSELRNCQSLRALWLDHNSFTGSIPSSISKMRGLEELNLAKNTLSGVIPQEFGLMGGIKAINLSHNNLSGHIPESFQNISLLFLLDLSFNHLDGKVPSQGVFSNMSEIFFDGNLGLCGGISELHLPPCLPEAMGNGYRKHHLVMTIAAPVAGVILCLCLTLAFYRMRKKTKAQSIATRGFQLMGENYPRISYAELVQGTSGFAIDNLIGRGRYGSVYKCVLLLNNMTTTVAVKVFDLQQSGSSKSFEAECEALSKIRHRNLISVITCCSSSDMNRRDFKALVFEFTPNGSLDMWLHLDVHASQQLHGLTLMQRLNIAVDIADGLDYLHNNCEPPIVHCDLKPSNILLNEDLVAHIGDFGLAKILHESSIEQQISSRSSIGIRGTIGYVAPEYGQGGQVSSCGDVYSFGSVILELFTGMAPTHEMFREGLTLQKYVENAFPGMLMQIVDPVLLPIEEANASSVQDGSNQMEHGSNAIFSVMQVGLSCSKHAPTERMCMRDATAAIHRIRDRHVKITRNEEALITAHNARPFAETSYAAETSRPAP